MMKGNVATGDREATYGPGKRPKLGDPGSTKAPFPALSLFYAESCATAFFIDSESGFCTLGRCLQLHPTSGPLALTNNR